MGFRVMVDPQATVLPGDDRPLIFLARHAGPGDSFALVWLILTQWSRTPRVVLKDVLLWDPGLDVMLTRLSGCFLPSRSGAGDDTTARVGASAARLSAAVSPASVQQLVTYLGGSGQAELSQLSPENVDQRVRSAAYLTMAMPAYQLC